MISRTRLRQLARELDVRLGYAEKNYVNSWILWAIYTGTYGENLLFKGGTALSKLYFPETWRYSEDLDFGVEGQFRGDRDDLEAALDAASRTSGIDFDVTKHRELRVEGYPTHYVSVDVQYEAILDHKNTTSLDIMIDEHVHFAPIEHTHEYEDTPAFEILAYSLEEIFAEKLRALYQRERARDYYDIYRMVTDVGFDDSVVLPAFQTKCEHDGLEIDVSDGLPAEKQAGIRDEWDAMLPDLVADIPDLDEAHGTIESYLESLVGAERRE